MSSTINDNESIEEYSDLEECGCDDYYYLSDDMATDSETVNQKKCDPEHFEFQCLTVDQVSWVTSCYTNLVHNILYMWMNL